MSDPENEYYDRILEESPEFVEGREDADKLIEAKEYGIPLDELNFD